MTRGWSGPCGSIGLVATLAATLAGMKLGGMIGWSWWWVLSPIWGALLVYAGLVAVFAVALMTPAGRQWILGKHWED